MIALAIVFAITAIAVLAIVLAAWALDQRSKWRRIAELRGRLRVRAIRQCNELAALNIVREGALIRYAKALIEENNLLRAQLVAYTEPPKFGRVLLGRS